MNYIVEVQKLEQNINKFDYIVGGTSFDWFSHDGEALNLLMECSLEMKDITTLAKKVVLLDLMTRLLMLKSSNESSANRLLQKEINQIRQLFK